MDFTGRVLMITGGTGSFGTTMLDHFLSLPVAEVRVVSRDEKKQEDQRQRFNDHRIRYHLADVRDMRAIDMICRGVDYIYHAAALKQVPSCEFHPLEAVATNILGTANVIDAAIGNGVERVVCLSTDKAVHPVNAMGLSKAMMEKVAVARARIAESSATVITTTRYGNVLASRGSVVPLFLRQVRDGIPITLTDPDMTRFIMTLEEAVALCLYAFEHGRNGDIFVQKAPAVSVADLATAVLEVAGRPDHPVRVIGTRHGEKQHETLLSREEMSVAQDHDAYFRVPADTRGLNYNAFVSQGRERVTQAPEFNSANTRRLTVPELVAVLRRLPQVQRLIAGELVDEA